MRAGEAGARARLLAAARELFGEQGFAVSDAGLAAAAGMSCDEIGALFATRDDLIEAVIAPLFAERWQPRWSALLADRSRSLEDRLSVLYIEYRGRVERTDARLWFWAGLAGAHASGRISGTLVANLIGPLIGELRHDCALPGLDAVPLSMAERELAQALHGAVAFINTRRFVFGNASVPALETLVPMIVRAYLPGMREELRRLHCPPDAASA
jgi:AcrR family transcriptional regulator